MAIRPIVRYPDNALRTVCAPIVRFDDDLRALADDLLETMRAAPGVGITGPHIGELGSIAVIQLAGDDRVRVYVNPVIEEFSSETQRHVEGSVSMPGITDEIERPAHIRVRYQTLDGTQAVENASGFLATCIQHEVDQLGGIFWLQRLSRLKRERAIRRWEKLRRVTP
ncbi:peptide deformylase [Mesorhizobium microcysteis]|uniref:Peptide deformylase-like n=1 Tax=Neoaquamicrobium microcysteis TaxID=2682781 RepID=A0A5D4H801_9HYPH|nr:peptide deformylase [Mesorhizobium microcysteis]TYR34950.1 peptide deformylase [Mesorhizobium microcysteis]